jgi:hypothetical protein
MLDGVYDNLSELAHIARLTPAEEAEVKRMMHQTPYNELKELAK